MNEIPFPSTGFLREKQVLFFFPVSRTTWWDGVKSGRYPKPVKLSPNTSGWRAEEIKALIVKTGGNDEHSEVIER